MFTGIIEEIGKVVAFKKSSHGADLVISAKTVLEDIELGDLERALKLSDRLSGHVVSGHVDLTTRFVKKEKLGEFYNMEFAVMPEFRKYIVKKGSITINGISLTIADINPESFVVAVIPHTFENTNLKELKNNDIVNIETDILAKYIENFVVGKEKKEITMNFLEENGFL